MKNLTSFVFLAFMSVALLAVPALAANVTWLGGTSTAWGTGTNWSTGAKPANNDSAYIPGGTTFQPAVSSNQTVGAILVDQGATLTVSNGTLTINKNPGTLEISGTVTFTGGNITVAGAGTQTLVLNSGALLRVNVNSFPAFDVYAFDPASTVEYGLGGNQTVDAQSYGNLVLSNSGTKTLPNTAMTVAGNFTMSGSASTTARAAIDIGGNVTLGSGTTFSAGNFSHAVGGNWENNGATFTANNSTIAFDGSAGQTIGGSSPSTFSSAVINDAAGVSLLSNVTVTATLTLTSGNVITGSSTLTLGSSQAVRGTLSRTSGTIVGNFARWFTNATVSNVLFPIGTSGNYRPANVSFTAAPTAGGTITAFFTASDPGKTGLPLSDAGTSIVNCGVEGYWTLTSSGLTGGTYSLDLTADGFSGVSVVSTLRLLKRPSGGGSWTLQGTHSAGTGTLTTPIVHRTGMSGFSEFGVGGASDNTLPVQIVSFGALITGQSRVTLNWSTVSETNNYGFEVQKSVSNSKDGYETIPGSFVPGHGTTLKPQSYSYVDENARPGVWYYRLKQIDLDGTVHYSDGLQVSMVTGVDETAPKEFALSQNYPNPFNPTTKLRFGISDLGFVTLKVYDVLGREVATLVNEIKQPGTYTVQWDASNVPSGLYFYKLESGAKSDLKKMLLLK